MLSNLKLRINKWQSPKSLGLSRPVVLLQSDDWGRVGVRDREGFEELRKAGVPLGQQAYDFYTLETAEDVSALHELLLRHRDSTGRAPCVVMNFVVANVDFQKTAADAARKIHLLPLAEGLPGKWKRPGLFDSYRKGIAAGTFFPAMHGTTHFCRSAIERALESNDKSMALLRTLWDSETPYIYWRMPWVGYEYWNPERKRFLNASQQEKLIRESAELFHKMFGVPALSACAPGYRANEDTYRAWRMCGIRIVQNGSGGSVPTYVDNQGMLRIYRNVDFEPATDGPSFSLERCLQQARQSLNRGMPAVVSVHAINFHSSLRDFRTPTLNLLDQFLTVLEAEYPNLLYVHDADLYQMAGHPMDKDLPRSVDLAATRQAAVLETTAKGSL
ncbi:MAG: hypothetical protein WA824_15305 [Candidatus Sulfotelmatobacter sp.]